MGQLVVCGLPLACPSYHYSPMTSPRAKQALIGKLGAFVQQYRRKAQRGSEPNDRKYDHKVEQIMRRLPPERLSQLLSEDETK